MAAPVTKPFIDLTIREVCLLFADLCINGFEEAVTRDNITGALLATASSKDDLKDPPFSLQINDRSAHRIFDRIQECLIYGVEHEEIHESNTGLLRAPPAPAPPVSAVAYDAQAALLFYSEQRQRFGGSVLDALKHACVSVLIDCRPVDPLSGNLLDPDKGVVSEDAILHIDKTVLGGYKLMVSNKNGTLDALRYNDRNAVDRSIWDNRIGNIVSCLEVIPGIVSCQTEENHDSVLFFHLILPVELCREMAAEQYAIFDERRLTKTWENIQTCLYNFAEPLLRRVVKATMEQMKNDFMAANPGYLGDRKVIMGRSDDSLLREFLTGLSMRHASFPNFKHLRCHKGGGCGPNKWCRFHCLSVETQMAAVYTQFGLDQELEYADITALAGIARECNLFEQKFREICLAIKGSKNFAVSHKNTDIEGANQPATCFDATRQLLERYEPHRVDEFDRFRLLCKKDVPARNVVEDIERTEEEVDYAQMTTEQYRAFKDLINPNGDEGPLRIKLKAPAGAGKTFMAIKLAAGILIYPRHYPDMKHLVIITHSAAVLYGPMMNQLQKELCIERYSRFLVPGLTVEPHCIVLRHDDVYVTMITIDYFIMKTCDLTKTKTMSAEELKKSKGIIHNLEGWQHELNPSMIIVDEAHHVFSYQPDLNIFGQHRLAVPGAVAAVMSKICGKAANLIVLFDHMQSFSDCEPVYPTKLVAYRGTLDYIIRMSLRTTDASSPFCLDLENRGYSERAIAKFYPQHENSIPGKDPQYVEVQSTAFMRNHFTGDGINVRTYLKEIAEIGRSLESETADMIRYYATSLVDAVLSLYGQGIRSPRHIAIAYPGLLSEDTSFSLLRALRGDLESRITQGTSSELETVLSWLPDASDIPSAKRCRQYYDTIISNSRILISSAENLAGLERTVVIVCGFHMPEYLRTRLGHVSRVDSRVFLAVSRCTYRVVFVEVKAESCFANHFQISQAQQEYGKCVVKYSFKETHFQPVIIENGDLFLPMSVDCGMLPTTASLDIERRTTIYFRNYSASNAQKVHNWFRRCTISSLRSVFFFFDSQTRGGHLQKAYDLMKTSCFANITRFICYNNTTPYSLKGFDGPLSLELIDMDNMALTGSIPANLGNLRNLQRLDLSNNQLFGSIPEELGSLSNLQTLQLSSNKLSGSIPMKLGNLRSLQFLQLNDNQLSGIIPVELGNLSNLKCLSLDNNLLSGFIPKEIGNLSNLQHLALSKNQLSGCIPKEIGNLSNLQRLCLSDMSLSCCIPDELGNLSNLQFLVLDNNQLSGNIPVGLGNLSNLQHLVLDNNQLSGIIPVELGNLSNLQYLTLSNNKLSGSIPKEIGNLSNLHQLYLSKNQISGFIPSELGNLSNLQQLGMSNNLLSGTIPANLGTLSNLQHLELNNNQLSGTIPLELGNLSSLQSFNFSHNQLSATIPLQLGGLSNLQQLVLSSAQLPGTKTV